MTKLTNVRPLLNALAMLCVTVGVIPVAERVEIVGGTA